jgi:anti-sigma B factor antagonist
VEMLTVTMRALAETDLVVELAGEIDLANASELGVLLMNELSRRQQGRMVIRMADVRFLDSTGLETLWLLRHRAAARGCTVVLAEPSRQVRRILVLSRSVGAFPVVGSEQECGVR